MILSASSAPPVDPVRGSSARRSERINELVRTSQRMLTEIGSAPTPEELAESLAIPLDTARRLIEIAPIRLEMPASGE